MIPASADHSVATKRGLAIGFPLFLLALVALAVTLFDPLARFGTGLPPDEGLAIERGTTEPNGIEVWVRGDGRDDVSIAQVQVDGAYWNFKQTPDGPLGRFEGALIEIPYPWVAGDAHHLTFVTSTGTTFGYSIDVARDTTPFSLGALFDLALLGLFVGVVPIALGLATIPILRRMGTEGMVFAMALTVGLLAFLLVDTLAEGLELAAEAAGAYQTDVIVWVVAALTFAALMALSRIGGRKGGTGGIALATWMALGIGLHNFGEGLSIGTALILGNAALGSLLIVGFTVHNLTEGIAIAAPVTRKTPGLWMFVGWTALAGLPAVAGAWIGAFAFLPHWGAIFFGIAAGAILQVMVEVIRFILALGRESTDSLSGGTAFAGFGTGVLAMYATAFLVQV
ncbi:MAG: metal transporter [Alphaproteobacteria bacterium]